MQAPTIFDTATISTSLSFLSIISIILGAGANSAPDMKKGKQKPKVHQQKSNITTH